MPYLLLPPMNLHRRTSLSMLVLATALLGPPRESCAQYTGTAISTADYQNRIYVRTNNPPYPTNFPQIAGVTGIVQALSVSLSSGFSNSAVIPQEPGGGNKLVSAAFGFPVTPTPLGSPNFSLGQEMVPPAGFNFGGV